MRSRSQGGAIPLFDGVRVTDPGFADMRLAADGTLLYVEASGAGPSGGAAARCC